ncbi:MAG: hypothetical protein AB4042_16950 [Leptolyngbyaceae cyanobacterium]
MPASDSPTSLPRLIGVLQQQYPGSHLIAEFLTYQEGQYAIRAKIQTETVTLATGMAAHVNIEVAEDRAKVRAIQALGLNEIADQHEATDQTDFPNPSPTPSRSLSTYQADESSDRPAPPIQPVPEQAAAPLQIVNPFQNQPEHSPPISADVAQAELGADPTVAPASPTSTRSVSPANPISIEPTNLLDQIAKTEVEMRRLGWNSDRGRQLLLERYGKRSRRELTDDEVLDFLHYLEQQP